MQVYTSTLPKILESAYRMRNEIVLCLIGSPGIGKTEIVDGFARSKGGKLVTFLLNNSLPSEVSGIKMPVTDTKSVEVFDDARLASLEDGDVLFFDEIYTASPALLNACLTLIQSRLMASGKKLPDVMIVAASNMPKNPLLIEEAVRDRFMTMEIVFDEKAWKKWFVDTRGVDADIMYSALANIRWSQCPDKFNILTPRRFTKFYDWCKASEGEERGTVLEFAEKMFGRSFSDALRMLVEGEVKDGTSKEKVRDAIFKMLSLEDVAKVNDEIEGTFAEAAVEDIVKAMASLGILEDYKEKMKGMEL